ncbi:MAG: hypothetical protein M3400_09240 [Actinomycetota bacterium]|nr:hypothetical protein [Actinomycetota bacterium]
MARKVNYTLTEPESAVLMGATKDALTAAGAVGGWLGDASTGSTGAAGAAGGAMGGRFGARFTKPVTAELTLEVRRAPAATWELVRATIAAAGTRIEDPNRLRDGSVWGIVQSGALAMMPALVRVQVAPSGSAGSHVHLRATGREGLIKQGIGAKAVQRIADRLLAG